MSETLTILVIDDDKGDRMTCQRALEGAFDNNLRLMEAEDGETGLAAIEKHLPHCVLLDHHLPGIDGLEVLKRIRIKHPYLAVIMMNGKGNDVVAVQSMKEGAQDYIAKITITSRILHRIIWMAIRHCILQKNTHEQRVSLEIFTRALAHDLKEPVRTIRSFIDQITDWRNLNEKSQKSLGYIRKAADRMNALIDTVYLYTRLDAAEQMEKTLCGIAGVLEEVKENLAQLIEDRGATITWDALPQVYANRVQMIQLFQNLIANAIRHCDKAVTILVDSREDGDHWQLAVRDNGPGIANEYLEKIFAPFRRLSHRKEDEPGLGLGLAINRKIVESYGGKIWCESRPGTGTSFLFTLPKTITSAAAADIASDFTLSPDERTTDKAQTLARVLLVDDNEADIELNRIILIEDAKLRCELLTACNAREALAELQAAARTNNPIDLILLDINMPGMSGFELLAEMQKQNMSQPPVVMCTTSAYDMDRRTGESFKTAGYLIKPLQFSLLKDIIDQCKSLHLRQEGSDCVLRRAA